MKATIVVDMLNDFAKPDGKLYCGPTIDKIIPKIAERLKKAEDDPGNLVIHICDSHEPYDEEFDRFPPHAVEGTEGAEIITELEPNDDVFVLGKTRYNGFFGTDLGALLRLYEVHEVTVVGCCTSICVMDTVGGLANRDYKVFVPKDEVADFDPEMHEFALKRMQMLYGAEIA